MTYLELFFVFARIGLFTFGGGYGMIPLIQQEVVSRGWMEADALYRYIGICESTPGPIAVNMATFIGASQGGLLGSVCATLGVVLPSFVIILLIAAVLTHFRENPWVQAGLGGIKPVVAGMITATGACVALKCLLNLGAGTVSVQWRQMIIAALLGAAMLAWTKALKRRFSPILMILCSAVLGAVVYAV